MQTDNAEKIMALQAPELIAVLKDGQATLFKKAKACQRLAVVGTAEAVPALAALLGDSQLAHYARFGLEPIPDPAVDEALRGALAKLRGNLLVGVLNSLGQRRDSKAIPAVSKLIGSRDPEVAKASAAALGHIGGGEAAKHLLRALGRGEPEVRAAAADACLLCAESLLAANKENEALAMYKTLGAEGVPRAVRMAAARGSAAASR